MRLGDLTIDPLLDGQLDVPAEVMLNQTPHERWLTPEGLLSVQMGGYLIRTGERVIVVDCGFGASADPAQGRFLDSLAEHGLAPQDVTDVVLTHLHFDHIGWTTDGEKATFPTETYRCDQRDWDHYVVQEHEEYMRDMVGALTPRARLAPAESQFETYVGDTPLAPGVDLRSAPGHTPGSTIVVLSGGGEKAMLLGDVLHCPAEMLSEDWEMLADVDAKAAARTREALAKELQGSGVLLGAAHFPGLRMGRLLSTEANGRDWAYV
jgi:glyoxylase-like metal-dependent hydrolase (beta-lactamase superfamily II)